MGSVATAFTNAFPTGAPVAKGDARALGSSIEAFVAAAVAGIGTGGGTAGIPHLGQLGAVFDGATDIAGVINASLTSYGVAIVPPLTGGAFGVVGSKITLSSRQALLGTGPTSALKMKSGFGTGTMIGNLTTNPGSDGAMDVAPMVGNLRILGNKAGQPGAIAGNGEARIIDFRACKDPVIFNIWGEDGKSDLVYLDTASGTRSRGCQRPVIWNVHGKGFGRNVVSVIGGTAGKALVFVEDYALHGFDFEPDFTGNVIRGWEVEIHAMSGGGGAYAGSGETSGVLCVHDGAGGTVEDITARVYGYGVTDSFVVFRGVRGLDVTVMGNTCSGNAVFGFDGGSRASSVTLRGEVSGVGGNGLITRTAGDKVDTDGFKVVQAANYAAVNLQKAAKSVLRGLDLDLTAQTVRQIGVELSGCNNCEVVNPIVDGASYPIAFENSGDGTGTTHCTVRGGQSIAATQGACSETGASGNNAVLGLKPIGGVQSVNLSSSSTVVQLHPFKGSKTWDPGAIAAGASATTTVTVTGVVNAANYQISATFGVSGGLAGLTLDGGVSADNTVTVVLSNNTGGSVDLASGTLTVHAQRLY